MEVVIEVGARDEELGTGRVVWDSGIVLGRLFAKQPQLVRGKRVLDLGSGTGIAGLAAARCGASEVLLTDMHGMQLLQTNVEHNALERVVSVASLEWGNMHHIAHACEFGSDVIIGSDVLYSKAGTTQLLQTIGALINSGDSTQILIAAPAKNCGTLLEQDAFDVDCIGEYSTAKAGQGFRGAAHMSSFRPKSKLSRLVNVMQLTSRK